ncbi:MAG: amidohydrolase family protein [Chloroflexi bacterium]|nr:amidohydrolase family protein [Chloroflexota bacterium]
MEYTLIRNGSLIDGTGAHPVEKAAVLIGDNKILDAGPESKVKLPGKNVTELDAKGGFILPGFIDTHVHLMSEKYDLMESVNTPFSYNFYKAIDHFSRTVMAGVTTVRDAGGCDLGTKKAIENGLVLGPRVKISVTGLSITGGHGDGWAPSGVNTDVGGYPGMPDCICDGVSEVRKKVREVLRSGAEVIKICSTGGVMSPTDRPEFTQFSPDELAAIVQEAHFHGGVKVMSHAQGSEGVKQAVLAGIHSIEHGIFLTDEIIQLMLERGTYLVPTLFAPLSIIEDPEMKEKLPPFLFQKAADVAEIHKESIAKAYKAGVKIAMGTDSGVMAHGKNLRELELLCGIGMTPMESILAATKVAAECLEWQDRIGTLEKGKLADVVVTRINPLDDIRSLTDHGNIAVIVKDGKIVKDIL